MSIIDLQEVAADVWQAKYHGSLEWRCLKLIGVESGTVSEKIRLGLEHSIGIYFNFASLT